MYVLYSSWGGHMPQLHLYVPETTAEALKRQAQTRGVSLSKYLAEILTREVTDGWPEGYFDNLGWEGDLTRPAQPGLETRRDL
jgi:hypothetical protein